MAYELTGFSHQHITPQAVAKAGELIQEFKLHREPFEPVNIFKLLSGFELHFMDLPDQTYGFALDLGRKFVIGVNQALDAATTRFVLLHEVGHTAMWHPNQLNNCWAGQWAADRLETETTTVAALIALPPESIRGGITSLAEASAIAALYDVPLELVLVRHAIRQATGA